MNQTKTTHASVTLDDGSTVALHINHDKVSHLKAESVLEEIADPEGPNQSEAVRMALCTQAGVSVPSDALEQLTAAWGVSDSEAVRESLRRYEVDS
jgi:hypothetical protein